MKLLLPFLLLIFLSCSDDDEPGIQLFTNTDVEVGTNAPSAWWIGSAPNTELNWSDQVAYSGTRSLEIKSSANQSPVPFWGQSIITDIPIGKKLTVNVRIKGTLEGAGAAVAISCLTSSTANQALQFSTTEGTSSIKGNIDWTSYTVTLNEAVRSDIREIRVYLMILPNTTGEVYFDDITLTAN